MAIEFKQPKVDGPRVSIEVHQVLRIGTIGRATSGKVYFDSHGGHAMTIMAEELEQIISKMKELQDGKADNPT